MTRAALHRLTLRYRAASHIGRSNSARWGGSDGTAFEPGFKQRPLCGLGESVFEPRGAAEDPATSSDAVWLRLAEPPFIRPGSLWLTCRLAADANPLRQGPTRAVARVVG